MSKSSRSSSSSTRRAKLSSGSSGGTSYIARNERHLSSSGPDHTGDVSVRRDDLTRMLKLLSGTLSHDNVAKAKSILKTLL